MAWDTPGRNRLPNNWATLRRRVLHRDGHQCVHTAPDGTRCPTRTNLECDHIHDRHNHHLTNLQTLCKTHHQQKTQHQAHTNRPPRNRPPTQHPGTRPPPPHPPQT